LSFYQTDEKPKNIVKVELDISDSYISIPDLSELGSMFSCAHKQNLEENIRRCFLFFF